MKVTRERAAENRDRIVAEAGRLLRQRGVDGIGVDALMQAAGLTHGGFYKNFASKEALVAEACERVMADDAAKWASTPPNAGEDTFRRWVKGYLSPAHCDALGEGCIFAALATDAGRRPGRVRTVFTNGLRSAVARLASICPGPSATRRERALASMAGLVGAVVLARATDDEAFRAELLAATAAMLLDFRSSEA